MLAHFLRQSIAEMALQNVAYAAFARLAVYSYYIAFVIPAHVSRIYRQIRHRPGFEVVFGSVLHSFCYSVLVRTGKCRKYQLACIRLTGIYRHRCKFFIFIAYFGKIFKIKLRVYAVRVHVHCNGDNVGITRPLTVAEKCSFDSLRSCQKSQLCVGNAASSIVVRME